MGDATIWFTIEEFEQLAASIPDQALGGYWEWVLEQAMAQEGDEPDRCATCDIVIRLLIDCQVSALHERLQGPVALDANSSLVGDGIAILHRCQERIEALNVSERRRLLEQHLSGQMIQVVGRLHQWLVIEEAQGAQRRQWFWWAWQQMHWLSSFSERQPEWWSPIQEQLLRSGALEWNQYINQAETSAADFEESITRTLTLLRDLNCMHDPLPEWIPELLKTVAAKGLAALLGCEHLAEDKLLQALAWLALLEPDRLHSTWQLNYQELNRERHMNYLLLALQQDLARLELQGPWIARLDRMLEEHRVMARADELLRAGNWQEARGMLDALATPGDAAAKVVIRTVHHMACTGGTVISKCIAAMPKVALVSEVNPLNRFGAKFEPTNTLLLLERSYRELTLEEIKDDFLSQINRASMICSADGVNLVIRDHSHSDFCRGKEVSEVAPIVDFLSKEYELLSVITVRHPLDSYLGLLAQGWQRQFEPSTLEEYSKRYLAFLSKYEALPIRRYEDFCLNPQPFMEDLCNLLKIDYSSEFLYRFGEVNLTGESGRTSTTEISPRERRPVPEEVTDEIAHSQAYSDLLVRLGYDG
ncbi:MAG: hypothetical protein ACKO8I_11910 [Cyanobacteriota bacterium]